jgi:hydroxysqualene dehydroxylase
VPWHALTRVWDPIPPPALSAIVAAAAGMRSSPIVSVNLWFDAPALPEPFVGLMGGPMHWAFDKARIAAGHLSAGPPTSHLTMVASGANQLMTLDNSAIAAQAVNQLRQAIPASAARVLRRSVVVREHRATFSVAPGSPTRPQTTTPVTGFYLAGDWIDTGLPATIESAVVSGHRAADAVLQRS